MIQDDLMVTEVRTNSLRIGKPQQLGRISKGNDVVENGAKYFDAIFSHAHGRL
jgi:hypothetical protein